MHFISVMDAALSVSPEGAGKEPRCSGSSFEEGCQISLSEDETWPRRANAG